VLRAETCPVSVSFYQFRLDISFCSTLNSTERATSFRRPPLVRRGPKRVRSPGGVPERLLLSSAPSTVGKLSINRSASLTKKQRVFLQVGKLQFPLICIKHRELHTCARSLQTDSTRHIRRPLDLTPTLVVVGLDCLWHFDPPAPHLPTKGQTLRP
jgi:hypothetical protein